MKAFLPVLQPDQTLESFTATAARINAVPWKTIVNYLFGSPQIRCELPFHAGLPHLSEHLPIKPFRTPEEVFLNHSPVALFIPFLDRATRDRVVKLLDSNYPTTISRVLGWNALDVFRDKKRFCPTCVKNEIARLGFAYVHRSHQVVGVHLCALHGTQLDTLDNGVNHENALLTAKDIAATRRTRVSVSPPLSRAVTSFSTWVQATYAGVLPASGEHLRIELISERLSSLNRNRGEPRSLPSRLDRLLSRSYGHEFLDEIGLSLQKESSAWPRLFFNGYSYRDNPVANIAILNLLFDSPQEYRTKIIECENRGKSRQTAPVKLKRNIRIHWSKALIKELLKAPSLKEIADRHQLDPWTLNEFLRTDTHLAQHREAALARWRIRNFRKNVRQFVERNPTCQRSEIYQARGCQRAMEWLVQNDVGFLDDLIPSRVVRNGTEKKKKRAELDQTMAAHAINIGNQLRESPDLTWVTRMFLRNALKDRFGVHTDPATYPITGQTIIALSESEHEFLNRCVEVLTSIPDRKKAIDKSKDVLKRLPNRNDFIVRINAAVSPLNVG